MGIRVDYLSPTLYFLDLIWLGFFVINTKERVARFFSASWRIRMTKKGKKKKVETRNDRMCLWLVGLVVVNVLVAKNWQVAVYGWLRVFQWIWVIKLIKGDHVHVELGSGKRGLGKFGIKNLLKTVISGWIVLESVLGLAQVVTGGSIGGIFYWLGERRFSYLTLGIAKFSLFREMMIRAYGTFSHPNSMAGFLLVAILLLKETQKSQITNSNFQTNHKSQISISKLFYWIVFWIGVMGIIVSGSRTVWMIGLLIILINNPIINLKSKIKISKKENKVKRFGSFLVVVGVMMILVGLMNGVAGGWDRESFSKRWELNKHALEMIRDNPLFGVGLGNFLVELPEYQRQSRVFWLQPVHNIPLLLISELGIVGILIFNFQFSIFNKFFNFLISKKRKNRIYKMIFMVILLTGMVDHYWVTLPQNWWLVAIILGYYCNQRKT